MRIEIIKVLLLACVIKASSSSSLFPKKHESTEEADDPDGMCRAAANGGRQDLYPVRDQVQSRGTNRQLVEQASDSIGRARNALAKGCSVGKGANKSAVQAASKLLYKRLIVSEWLGANVPQPY